MCRADVDKAIRRGTDGTSLARKAAFWRVLDDSRSACSAAAGTPRRRAYACMRSALETPPSPTDPPTTTIRRLSSWLQYLTARSVRRLLAAFITSKSAASRGSRSTPPASATTVPGRSPMHAGRSAIPPSMRASSALAASGVAATNAKTATTALPTTSAGERNRHATRARTAPSSNQESGESSQLNPATGLAPGPSRLRPAPVDEGAPETSVQQQYGQRIEQREQHARRNHP